MTLEFRPLTEALGAEARGIDLREPLSADTVETVVRAWQRYAVLVFRDQQISADDQKRFTSYFGSFQLPRGGAQSNNQVLFIGNTEVDGVPADIPLGPMQFHQDGAYGERPTKASMLYALELPPSGGNTLFASLARAYDSFPAAQRERLVQLDIRFNFDNATTIRSSAWRKDIPDYTHPLVVAHPDTGRPMLFCNRLMADAIVGLPPAESDDLIAQLCARIEEPENVYEHVWRPRDFVIWDNVATAHGRTDFDPRATRLLRRTTIMGARPIAYRDAARLTSGAI
jgi:taurine dioxygenase